MLSWIRRRPGSPASAAPNAAVRSASTICSGVGCTARNLVVLLVTLHPKDRTLAAAGKDAGRVPERSSCPDRGRRQAAISVRRFRVECCEKGHLPDGGGLRRAQPLDPMLRQREQLV